jgi:predicted lipoprotein with Yx(FWY)xxD motif
MGSTPTRSVARLAALASAVVMLAAACTTGGGASSGPTAAVSAAPVASPAAATSGNPGGGKDGSDDEYGNRASATPAGAGGEVHEVGVGNGPDGDHLTGEGGRTLYVFGNDSANTSKCDGGCATTWPPFTIAGDDQLKAGSGVTGKLTTFARTDGSMQVAYGGSPLYYYAADKAAGDTNGQGVGDVWYIAQP